MGHLMPTSRELKTIREVVVTSLEQLDHDHHFWLKRAGELKDRVSKSVAMFKVEDIERQRAIVHRLASRHNEQARRDGLPAIELR